MPNRILAYRYHLLDQLAEGGMGVTYRAWDGRDQRPVVIKMPKRPGNDPDGKQLTVAVARFRREIEAMKSVQHPHVVPVLDSGEDDGFPFVVMRLLPGGSLADRRTTQPSPRPRYRPLPPSQLHSWLRGVASALDHIHALGMIHRDVKPTNVFFDAAGQAYLGDFGIAKAVDPLGAKSGETLTATHMAIGTPEYMAPELTTQGASPGGAADQYALAVTVYEVLSGRRPFTGLQGQHIIVEHAIKPPPPLDGGLPRSLTHAIERGLAKKPELRFSTCHDFAEAILSDIPLPPDESAVARLLCPNPSCGKLLKIARTETGKRGSCPGCHALVEIAQDLSALWLQSEIDSLRPKWGRFFDRFDFEKWSRHGSELEELDVDDTEVSATKIGWPLRRLVSLTAILFATIAVVLIGRREGETTSSQEESREGENPIVGLWSWQVGSTKFLPNKFLKDGVIEDKAGRWVKLENTGDRFFYVVVWPKDSEGKGPYVDLIEVTGTNLKGRNNDGAEVIGSLTD